MTEDQTKELQPQRIALIDVARGLALVAMAIYHFTWDLEYFGWLAPATTFQTGWVLFARCIASSFLILVGISMVLAHGEAMRWQSFKIRFVQVAGAAALISLVTYFAIPGGFIFFGILHAIALFSVLGLLFLRIPWPLTLIAAALVLLIGNNLRFEVFNIPALWWVGLAPIPPQSNDFVPVFPWFATVLIGIALARMGLQFGIWQRLGTVKMSHPASRPLTFIGRHSLAFYLIHQPILLVSIWLFTSLAGEPDKTPQFLFHCQNSCLETSSEAFCTTYCSCMVDEMKDKKLFTPFLNGALDDAQNGTLLQLRDMCVVQQTK